MNRAERRWFCFGYNIAKSLIWSIHFLIRIDHIRDMAGLGKTESFKLVLLLHDFIQLVIPLLMPFLHTFRY